MTGNEEYKEKFLDMAKNQVAEHNNIKYLDDFYYYLVNTKSPSTVYNYINYVVRFLEATNIEDPKEITFSSYNRYLATLINDTSSYRIAVHSALKRFSIFLAANEITKDYMASIDRPVLIETQKTKEKREKSILTDEDVKKAFSMVLSSNKSDIWKQRDYCILLVLLTTGIRCSALCKLDLQDFDMEKKTITVTEKRSKVRSIMLPQKTYDELVLWITLRNSIKDLYENALFVSNQKKRVNQRGIYRIVNKYTGQHPHSTRSTYGTTLYSNSEDLYLTQQNMGQSNPKTTELYIRGKDNDVKRRAVDIIENCFLY